MDAVSFREVVAAEFARRRRQNARYSLRGFARALHVHHATLSRLLKGNRRVQWTTIAALGPRLGLTSGELQDLINREDLAALVAAIRRPAFRADSRWLASVTGIPVDRVNIALQALLCGGRLRMATSTRWQLHEEGATVRE